MSWHSELTPPPLTLGSLVNDLVEAWRVYARAGLPLTDRLAFLTLRATQRVAYGLGWRKGKTRG